ncbi:MAG TPA: hypothetical protein VKB46_21800 [Pyrinomonadaceae bacterium]|nr:hypothetical protein [Pyrinomonadaceae bacterium]
MHHLVPAAILLTVAFFLLASRFPATKAYPSVSWVPVTLLLAANAAEHWYGIGWFSHVMFHLAYDTSYMATLLGIVLVLTLVLKRKSYLPVLIAILIAAIPLTYLILLNY